ncbi:MAG: hypothetical protein KF908_02085 [Nitrosomonas sp.]|nr:hypothetical protein [Nitrosomonas sp.]
MMPEVQVLERTVRRAPLGLCVWDIATATHSIAGLEIDVVMQKHPQSRVRAFVNRSGIYCAANLPGLHEFELGDTDNADTWKALHRYRVEVRDPADRFLPFSFDIDLPVRGLINWPTSWASLLQSFVPLTEGNAPPARAIEYMPLFSSPGRQVAGPLAVIRAQLREDGTDRPAAWCLLTVSIDATVHGIGLADREGRVAILFPYPKRPRPELTSPPSVTNSIRWDLVLTAYYVPYVSDSVDTPAPDIPDLSTVFEQLNAPRTLFPEVSLLQLEYGKPLTVRSADSSFLFVSTT